MWKRVHINWLGKNRVAFLRITCRDVLYPHWSLPCRPRISFAVYTFAASLLTVDKCDCREEIRSVFALLDLLCTGHLESCIWHLPIPFVLCCACVLLLSDKVKIPLADFFSYNIEGIILETCHVLCIFLHYMHIPFCQTEFLHKTEVYSELNNLRI